MRIVYKKESFGVTLVELVVAVLLLSTVILTAVTIELAVRRMQTTPTAKVKLLDELMPVINMIKKDYDRHVGNVFNSSVNVTTAALQRILRIRVDDGSASLGKVGSDDTWYSYRWNGTDGNPIEYLANTTTFLRNLAYGISYFNVSAPTGKYDEAIKVHISKKAVPGSTENPITNPVANITTTFYAPGASLR